MSKILQLVTALHQKTMEKKVLWELQDRDSLVVNIGSNSITVESSLNDNLSHRFDIAVRDIDGQIIDEESFSENQMPHLVISEMTSQARRNLLRADETIDEILERINQL